MELVHTCFISVINKTTLGIVSLILIFKGFALSLQTTFFPFCFFCLQSFDTEIIFSLSHLNHFYYKCFLARSLSLLSSTRLSIILVKKTLGQNQYPRICYFSFLKDPLSLFFLLSFILLWLWFFLSSSLCGTLSFKYTF